MPPVKGRKKTTSRKKPATRRSRSKAPAKPTIAEYVSRLWSGVVTYAVVGLCVAAVATVLMLAAGGYFANIGERIETLSGRATKAIGFSVGQVTAKGQGEVSDRDIMNALRDPIDGEILGRSLMTLDVHELRSRVETLPWVKSAAVQKLWPDTVHVTIVERAPIALWKDRNLNFHLIDAHGIALDVVEDTDAVGLPILTGTDDPTSAVDVLTALAAREQLYDRIAAVISVNDRRFDLRFRNDFTAKLPESDIAAALDRLEGLGAGTGKLAANLRYLDLRDPRWAFFRRKSS